MHNTQDRVSLLFFFFGGGGGGGAGGEGGSLFRSPQLTRYFKTDCVLHLIKHRDNSS